MKFLFQNNGRVCAAKSAFMCMLFLCMLDIFYARVSGGVVDFSGWATLLTVLAGLYWGRANTKANAHD
jgi:hypothetical protein